MAGMGTPHIRYRLYLRKRDGVLRLTNAATGAIVPIRGYWLAHYATGSGVHVLPERDRGIFVFEDEMVHVEEFPMVEEVEGERDGSTAQLVEVSHTQLLASA